MYVEAITTPHVKYEVCIITCVVSWHALSRVIYRSPFCVNNDLHEKVWYFTCEKLWGTMHGMLCVREVIVELYRR